MKTCVDANRRAKSITGRIARGRKSGNWLGALQALGSMQILQASVAAQLPRGAVMKSASALSPSLHAAVAVHRAFAILNRAPSARGASSSTAPPWLSSPASIAAAIAVASAMPATECDRHGVGRRFPVDAVCAQLRRKPQLLPFCLAFGLRFPCVESSSSVQFAQRCIAAAAAASPVGSVDAETRHLLQLHRAAFVEPLLRFALPLHLAGVAAIDQLRLSVMPRFLLRRGLLRMAGARGARLVSAASPGDGDGDGACALRDVGHRHRSADEWQRILDAVLDAYSPSDPLASRDVTVADAAYKDDDLSLRKAYCADVIRCIVEPLLLAQEEDEQPADAEPSSRSSSSPLFADTLVASLVKLILRCAASFEEVQWLLARLFALRVAPMNVELVSLLLESQPRKQPPPLGRASAVVANTVLEEITEFTACLERGALPCPAWFINGCALSTTAYFDRNPPALLLVAAASAFCGRWGEALGALTRASAEQRLLHRRASPTLTGGEARRDDHADDADIGSVVSASAIDAVSTVAEGDGRWECHPQLALFACIVIHRLAMHTAGRGFDAARSRPGGLRFRHVFSLLKSAFVVTRVPTVAERRAWSATAFSTCRAVSHAQYYAANGSRHLGQPARWDVALRGFACALGGHCLPVAGYSYEFPAFHALVGLCKTAIGGPLSGLQAHASALQSPLLWAHALAIAAIGDDGAAQADAAVLGRLHTALDCCFFLCHGHPAYSPRRGMLNGRLLARLSMFVAQSPPHVFALPDAEQPKGRNKSDAPESDRGQSDDDDDDGDGGCAALSKRAREHPAHSLLRRMRRLHWIHTADEEKLIAQQQRRRFAEQPMLRNSNAVAASAWLQAVSATSASAAQPVVDGDRRSSAVGAQSAVRRYAYMRLSPATMGVVDEHRRRFPQQFMCCALLDLLRQRGFPLAQEHKLQLALVFMRCGDDDGHDEARRVFYNQGAALVRRCGTEIGGHSVGEPEDTPQLRQALDALIVNSRFYTVSRSQSAVVAAGEDHAGAQQRLARATRWMRALLCLTRFPETVDHRQQHPKQERSTSIALPPSPFLPELLRFEALLTAHAAHDAPDDALRIPRCDERAWQVALQLLHDAAALSALRRPHPSSLDPPFPVDEFLFRCHRAKAPLWLVWYAVRGSRPFVSRDVGVGVLRSILASRAAECAEDNFAGRKLRAFVDAR